MRVLPTARPCFSYRPTWWFPPSITVLYVMYSRLQTPAIDPPPRTSQHRNNPPIHPLGMPSPRTSPCCDQPTRVRNSMSQHVAPLHCRLATIRAFRDASPGRRGSSAAPPSPAPGARALHRPRQVPPPPPPARNTCLPPCRSHAPRRFRQRRRRRVERRELVRVTPPRVIATPPITRVFSDQRLYATP